MECYIGSSFQKRLLLLVQFFLMELRNVTNILGWFLTVRRPLNLSLEFFYEMENLLIQVNEIH
jgi:hypothetical protein